MVDGKTYTIRSIPLITAVILGIKLTYFYRSLSGCNDAKPLERIRQQFQRTRGDLVAWPIEALA